MVSKQHRSIHSSKHHCGERLAKMRQLGMRRSSRCSTRIVLMQQQQRRIIELMRSDRSGKKRENINEYKFEQRKIQVLKFKKKS